MVDDGRSDDVLVIGAGMAGIEASLQLAQAGRRVHLVEQLSCFGGSVIRFEDIYPNMDCATCMIAPKQQDLLQSDAIDLLTLSSVEKVSGEEGGFKVRVKKRARYVSEATCIGCGMCFEACPVSLDNEFEEGMTQRKAIFIPCAGALPNVPSIDMGNCLRSKGEDCKLCAESCMFEAIELDSEDEVLDLDVDSIIIATGYEPMAPASMPRFGYGKVPEVYSAVEFERLYASNGPTEGELKLKSGKAPGSVAIVHCVGREEQGYCSAVCCLYSLKFAHYVKHKLPDARVISLHTDLCLPGKTHQRFHDRMVANGAELVRTTDVKVDKGSPGVAVKYKDGSGKATDLKVDMVVLTPAMVPREGAQELAKIVGVPLDDFGFFVSGGNGGNIVATPKDGVYVVGCASGPKDISHAVTESDMAVAEILSRRSQGVS
jgi:heterodisulfide reductase subunit A